MVQFEGFRSVGLTDIVSVPGLTNSESGTLGVQLCANADAAVESNRREAMEMVRNDMMTLWFFDLLVDLNNNAC